MQMSWKMMTLTGKLRVPDTSLEAPLAEWSEYRL